MIYIYVCMIYVTLRSRPFRHHDILNFTGRFVSKYQLENFDDNLKVYE
jgi:hypothetical protein